MRVDVAQFVITTNKSKQIAFTNPFPKFPTKVYCLMKIVLWSNENTIWFISEVGYTFF